MAQLPDLHSATVKSPARPTRSATAARPGKFQKNSSVASTAKVPSSPIVFVPTSPRLSGQLQATLVQDSCLGSGLSSVNGGAEDGSLVTQWAAKHSFKLKDSVSSLLNRAQPVTTLKRADRCTHALRILSDNLKSYKDIFDALAEDIKLIASELADETDINRGSQNKFDLQLRAKDQAHQLATIELTNEVGMLKRKIQDTAEAAVMVQLREQQLDKKTAEIETVRLSNAKREEDIALARRTQDVLFTQFAVRNKGLQEEIEISQKSAQDSKTKADELNGICQRYALRVYRLEQNAIESTRQHEATVKSITNALKASQLDAQRLSTALSNLRTLKRSLDDELADTKRRLDTALSELAEGKLVNTPRPSFRFTEKKLIIPSPTPLQPKEASSSEFDERSTPQQQPTPPPAQPSTIDQVQALYDQLDRSNNELWHVQGQLDTCRRALKVSEVLTRAMRSSPLAGADNQPSAPGNMPIGVVVMPFAAPQVTMSSGRMGGARPYALSPCEPLPLMMITGSSVLQVRAWSLSETIRRVKEFFDVWVTQNNRTTKSVELHTAIAVNLLDTAALATAHTAGNVPPPQTSLVPTPVAEHMYTLQFNARIWSSNAIVSTFRSILQEEVGVWLWGAQNKFIATHLSRLSKLGAITFADLREALESALLADGFMDKEIEPIVRQFGRSFIPDTILRDHKRLKSVVDEAEVPVKVDATPFMPFIEPKGSSAPTATSINESAAVQSLRFLYLHRQQQFYQRMDSELINRVNQEDWYPSSSAGSPRRGGKASPKFAPQHPSSLGTSGFARPSVAGALSPHSPVGGGNTAAPAPAPPNSVSEFSALQCLRSCVMIQDLPAAERFIKDVFKACKAQHKMEFARIREMGSRPEYCGNTSMASHQVFLPGYTAHYFWHQYPHYPTLQTALDMLLVEGQHARKGKKRVPGITYGDGTDPNKEFISVSDGNNPTGTSFSNNTAQPPSSSSASTPPHPAWLVEDLKEHVPLILFLRMYRKVPFTPTGLRAEDDHGSDEDCF